MEPKILALKLVHGCEAVERARIVAQLGPYAPESWRTRYGKLAETLARQG